MRGKTSRQPSMWYTIDLEEMVAADHPLRPIKRLVDAELSRMSERFSKAYSREGRPSVPPERLLKALLLQALYSIRSERQLVERIRFDLLFRWFLDMDPEEVVFDASTFSRNRQRMADFGLQRAFFDGIVAEALGRGLASDEHFTVDGTLIESLASIKSVKPIVEIEPREEDDDRVGPPPASRGRNVAVDFRGERRTNRTHRSTTDPEARLYSKGQGNRAMPCHSAHLLSENRNGLIVGVGVAEANGRSEREQALAMLDRARQRHWVRPRTVAADRGYDAGEFLRALESRQVTPHVAMRAGVIRARNAAGDARRRMKRRMRTVGYAISQRRRKVIEEAFGWIKDIAGLRKSRHVGRWKLEQNVLMAATAYNLIRMSRIAAG